ncbi:hypothetical protein Tco_0228751 [Tanacetum coccineum]
MLKKNNMRPSTNFALMAFSDSEIGSFHDCDEDETVVVENLLMFQKPKQLQNQPRETATGKESSNPFMVGSLPKTISLISHLFQKDSNNVDEESQKIERQAPVMISDAEEYLISEDPVKQVRMESLFLLPREVGTVRFKIVLLDQT